MPVCLSLSFRLQGFTVINYIMANGEIRVNRMLFPVKDGTDNNVPSQGSTRESKVNFKVTTIS